MTNVYAKFRNFPLRINKALGIFRKRVTTTTVVALRDHSGSKNKYFVNSQSQQDSGMAEQHYILESNPAPG